MKVRIGNYLFDSNKESIMIILTREDKKNINNMWDNVYKYCSYPEGTPKEEIKKFMDIENCQLQDNLF